MHTDKASLQSVLQDVPQAKAVEMAIRQYHEAQRHELGYRPQTPYLSEYNQARNAICNPAAWDNAEAMMQYCISEEDEIGEEPFVPDILSDEYSEITYAKASGAEPDFEPYATRTLCTLREKLSQQDFLKDVWGGDTDKQLTKTGWFHVEKQGQRWYMVDPDGNACYQAAISSVNLSSSDRARQNAIEKYGSLNAWAEATAHRLHEIGFTAAGNWSDMERLTKTKEQMGVCGRSYFITSYAEEKRIACNGIGHKVFGPNNAMPVFDRDFEEYAFRYAEETIGPYRDCNRIAGWFSDNEIPTNLNMLERFLTLDPVVPEYSDSLTTAWTYLKHASGKENPSLDDVTDEMSETFRGMVYERYFSVVCGAIRHAAPHHLYLGCRFSCAGKQQQGGRAFSQGIFRAAGHWCDAISINYYFAWTPDKELIGNWLRWSGRPIIISEWYAMAVDSGLKCSIGGGFKVRSQEDRAAFFQNFVLWLLECPGVIGYHWLMYLDNDPQQKGAELSNINGNKGIFSVDLQEYTTLTSAMQEIHDRLPALIEYFDCRNGIGE